MTRTIGKYQIQGELGRGGFGTVYRAWDPTVNRAVAIKVLTVQGDEDLLTRFRNEAAAAGSLHHRNIVTIHDFGEHNGVPYMVMQLLEGQTLQEVIATRKPLTVVQKLHIMGQVADGLNHAHLHGIVHRDVKPPNIMVLPDETVQIMDFGIARLTSSAHRQTRTGFVIGTVLYMAPEQFLPNKIVDHRADIWAYGVIFYELLGGQHPFAAPEETAVLYKVAHMDPPPLSSVCPEYPAALDDVVQRLLAKEPELRYSSLRDVQFDIQPILVDLRREQADRMLDTVRQLTADERLEEASATAQQVLELDPGNREAHSLLVSVKQRLQRRQIQPKIESLLQKAEQELQSRAWSNATSALESALRLSQTDPAIRKRLTQVRALEEQARRSERLLSDAHREMRAHNLTGALKMASEAAEADPGNASAAHLMSQIRREIEIRQAQGRLHEGLGKARELLLVESVDEALALLDDLSTEFGEEPGVLALIDSARREKEQLERVEHRRTEVAALRGLLTSKGFEEAVSKLEMLLAEFPGDVELTSLLAFAGEQADAGRKAGRLREVRSEVDRRVGVQDFAGALALIDAAAREYPGDSLLARLRESVVHSRADLENRRNTEATARILAAASEAERRGDYGAAVTALERGMAELPGSEPLQLAASRLRQQVTSARVTEIERLLTAEDFGAALAIIESSEAEFPGDPIFSNLRSRASALKRHGDLELARTRIRAELDAGRPAVARDMAGTALRRFPGEPALVALEREAREAADRLKPAVVPVPVPERPLPPVVHDESPPPARNMWLPVAGGAAAVMLLLGAVVFFRSGKDPVPATPGTTVEKVISPPTNSGDSGAAKSESSSAPVTPPSGSAVPGRIPSQRETQVTELPGRKPTVPPKDRSAVPESRHTQETEQVQRAERIPGGTASGVVGDSGGTGRVNLGGPDSGSSSGVRWSGPTTGKLAWSGQLPPGGKVTFNTRGLVSGPGEVTAIAAMPNWGDVDIVAVKGGNITASLKGSFLTVTNTGTAPMESLEVSWKLR